MNLPKVAQKFPYVVDEKAGKKAFCTCGTSSNQPYCDGSHQGTAFTPVPFTVEAKKRVALCNCKHTANGPFCDGTHKNL